MQAVLNSDDERERAVGRSHFQPVTVCHGLVAFFFQSLFELSPIRTGINAACKNPQDINDGEEPFLILGIPSAADGFFFKEDDGGHGGES